jgi:hypothetical protein
MKLQFSAICLSGTLVAVNALPADPVDAQAPAPVAQATQTVVVAPPGPAKAASDVVKMFDAGVKEPAILAYVSTAPPMVLTADDVIYMHNHGIPGDVITTMLKHHADLGTVQAPAAAQAQPPLVPPASYATAQPAYVSTDGGYPYSYPYYDYGYGYPYYYPYSSIAIGGSFWFGNPWFHSGFHNGFHNSFHNGFHTVPVHHGSTAVVHSGFNGGFHTVNGGGFHTAGGGGFHTAGGGGFHTAGGGGGFHGGGGGGGGHHH